MEQDRGRRFALWALMHLLGAAPDLDVAFKDAADRDAARDFMEMMERGEEDLAGQHDCSTSIASSLPPKSSKFARRSAPIRARASGAEKAMRPAAGSASSSPTMARLRSLPSSRKVTVVPISTVSPDGAGTDFGGHLPGLPVAQVALGRTFSSLLGCALRR